MNSLNINTSVTYCNYIDIADECTIFLKFKNIVLKPISYMIFLIIKKFMYGAEMATEMSKKITKLFKIAENQHGYFTAKQAASAGFLPTNFTYHVKSGTWTHEGTGIYRLKNFPNSRESQRAFYSLWSRNRNDEIQGVYSHETALAHYEISDVNPSKLHMTVPKSFRRNSKIPKVLKLHFADLTKEMIQDSRGFLVTKIGRTISDVIQCGWIPFDIVRQAITESYQKGLMQKWEIESTLNHVKVPQEIHNQLQQIIKEIR